jgi:diphosphomevalonate decarboxylase
MICESKNKLHLKIKSSYKTAPNIAFIKYWGKFNESNIIPLNTSIGITLSTDDLCTITKVTLSDQYESNVFILNDIPT